MNRLYVFVCTVANNLICIGRCTSTSTSTSTCTVPAACIIVVPLNFRIGCVEYVAVCVCRFTEVKGTSKIEDDHRIITSREKYSTTLFDDLRNASHHPYYTLIICSVYARFIGSATFEQKKKSSRRD